MHRLLYRSIVGKIFFVLFFVFASAAQAACIAPGDTCSFGTGSTTADTCCSPVTTGATQTYYSCKLKVQLKASVVYTCQADAQQPGNTNCAKKTENCDNNASDTQYNSCCKYDTDGSTPLQCNFQGSNPVGTCGAANTGPNACANEGQPCVGDGGVQTPGGPATCCSTYNASNKKLTCTTNGQVVPADKTGTCGYVDLTPSTAPTLPPPPSPPCISWANGQCSGIQSAFGALSTTPEVFIQTIFGILLSLSGAIALLLIMRAGYQMMISQGKPEQLNAARDQLIAAIVGLVFLIFSFVLLQAIGFDILKIPGFGA